MIYCKKESRNVELFYCQVICENKKYHLQCPYRSKPQIQLTLSGKPHNDTPAILKKNRRKQLKQPDKYHP